MASAETFAPKQPIGFSKSHTTESINPGFKFFDKTVLTDLGLAKGCFRVSVTDEMHVRMTYLPTQCGFCGRTTVKLGFTSAIQNMKVPIEITCPPKTSAGTCKERHVHVVIVAGYGKYLFNRFNNLMMSDLRGEAAAMDSMRLPGSVAIFDPNTDPAGTRLQARLKELIEDKKENTECNTFIFFYNGHGDPGELVINQEKGIGFGDLELKEIGNKFKGRKVFVLASCASGAFGQQMFTDDSKAFRNRLFYVPKNQMVITQAKGSEKVKSCRIADDFGVQYAKNLASSRDLAAAYSQMNGWGAMITNINPGNMRIP